MRRLLTTRLAVAVWLAVWAVALPCAAARFRTPRLEQMARMMRLSLPDSLPAGATLDSVSAYMGKPVRVCVDAYGEVSHIGYEMFAPEMAALYQSEPLFRFVERYLLELDLRMLGMSPEVRMDADGVRLVRGTLASLRALTPQTDMGFEMEEMRRHYFRLTWRPARGGEVCMVIPADCQLILGANAIELELMAERDIQRATAWEADSVMRRWQDARVVEAQDATVLDGGGYLHRAIRADLYLRPGTAEEGGEEEAGWRRLIWSTWQPGRSVSNQMLTGLCWPSQPLALTMNRYGFKRDQMDVTLQQFIAFCLQEGCRLYFGIKSVKDNTLSGTLFAYNERYFYAHMLDVTFPLSLLAEGAEGRASAMSWVYIPLKLLGDKPFMQEFERTPDMKY